MGKRGPKPLPMQVKYKRGTLQKCRQSDRPVKENPIDNIPNPPVWICGAGKMIWAVQIRELSKMQILNDCDLPMFAAYCHEYGLYEEANSYIIEQAKATKQEVELLRLTEKGKQLSYYANAHLKVAQKISAEFGFTPSSRTGISEIERKQDNPLSELMKNAK